MALVQKSLNKSLEELARLWMDGPYRPGDRHHEFVAMGGICRWCGMFEDGHNRAAARRQAILVRESRKRD